MLSNCRATQTFLLEALTVPASCQHKHWLSERQKMVIFYFKALGKEGEWAELCISPWNKNKYLFPTSVSKEHVVFIERNQFYVIKRICRSTISFYIVLDRKVEIFWFYFPLHLDNAKTFYLSKLNFILWWIMLTLCCICPNTVFKYRILYYYRDFVYTESVTFNRGSVTRF